MRKLVQLSVAAIAFVAPSLIAAQEVGRNEEVWTWQGRIERGRELRISSINGPVTVTASRDNMIHVRAEKEVRRGDVTDVAFQVVQSGGNVQVCALWYRDTCDSDGINSPRNDGDRRENRRDVKVRFTVQVPEGVRLEAETVNGEMSVRDVTADVDASTVNGGVEVMNVGGEVRASTVNGRVEVSTRNGPVTATTVNGDVDVKMAAIAGSEPMKFTTVNGRVRVEMPESMDADVEMETMHGSISSDYPVQLSGRFGPRHARGTIGRGGRRIELETLNGSVELRKAR
jgi:hypothetical protein